MPWSALPAFLSHVVLLRILLFYVAIQPKAIHGQCSSSSYSPWVRNWTHSPPSVQHSPSLGTHYRSWQWDAVLSIWCAFPWGYSVRKCAVVGHHRVFDVWWPTIDVHRGSHWFYFRTWAEERLLNWMPVLPPCSLPSAHSYHSPSPGSDPSAILTLWKSWHCATDGCPHYYQWVPACARSPPSASPSCASCPARSNQSSYRSHHLNNIQVGWRRPSKKFYVDSYYDYRFHAGEYWSPLSTRTMICRCVLSCPGWCL